jgi:hypothetical protein
MTQARMDTLAEMLVAERRDNARLRAALNEIRGCPDWYTATKIACAALFPVDEQDVEPEGPMHLAWNGALRHPGEQKDCTICHSQSGGKSAAHEQSAPHITNGPTCHPDAFWTVPRGATSAGTYLAVCSTCGKPADTAR